MVLNDFSQETQKHKSLTISTEPAVFRPPPRQAGVAPGRRVVLVGKGISFHTGGLALNPAAPMVVVARRRSVYRTGIRHPRAIQHRFVARGGGGWGPFARGVLCLVGRGTTDAF